MAVTHALIVNELLYSQMRFNIRDRLVMAEPYTWRLASTQTSFQRAYPIRERVQILHNPLSDWVLDLLMH